MRIITPAMRRFRLSQASYESARSGGNTPRGSPRSLLGGGDDAASEGGGNKHTHRKRAKAVFGKATKEVEDVNYKPPHISKDFATTGFLQKVRATPFLSLPQPQTSSHKKGNHWAAADDSVNAFHVLP